MELVLTTILVVALRDTLAVHATLLVRLLLHVEYYNILQTLCHQCIQSALRILVKTKGFAISLRILAGSYMCVCMPGYSGDFCEDGQHNKNSTDVYAILHNMYTGVPTKPPTDQLSVIIGATIGCIAVLCQYYFYYADHLHRNPQSIQAYKHTCMTLPVFDKSLGFDKDSQCTLYTLMT